MDAHKEHRRHGGVRMVVPKTNEREQHDADFENLDADGHGALAETVGQKAAGHGKQNEGGRKQEAQHGHDGVALLG